MSHSLLWSLSSAPELSAASIDLMSTRWLLTVLYLSFLGDHADAMQLAHASSLRAADVSSACGKQTAAAAAAREDVTDALVPPRSLKSASAEMFAFNVDCDDGCDVVARNYGYSLMTVKREHT